MKKTKKGRKRRKILIFNDEDEEEIELLTFRKEIVELIPDKWFDKKYKTRKGDRKRTFTTEDKIKRILERTTNILRLSIKKVKVKVLKQVFDKYFDKEIKTGKDTIVQSFVDKFFGKKDNVIERRKKEKEVLEKTNINFDYIFIKFNGIPIPKEVILMILDYMEYNMDLITKVGAVSKDFYLCVLTSWRSIRISRKNIHSVSLLVLKYVRAVKFGSSGWGLGGTSNMLVDDFVGLFSKMKSNSNLKTIHTFYSDVNTQRLLSALNQMGKGKDQITFNSVESLFVEGKWKKCKSIRLSSFLPNLRIVKLESVESFKVLEGLKYLINLDVKVKCENIIELRESLSKDSLKHLRVLTNGLDSIEKFSSLFLSQSRSCTVLRIGVENDDYSTKTVKEDFSSWNFHEIRALETLDIYSKYWYSRRCVDIDGFFSPVKSLRNIRLKLKLLNSSVVIVLKALIYERWDSLTSIELISNDLIQNSEMANAEKPENVFNLISQVLCIYGGQLKTLDLKYSRLMIFYRSEISKKSIDLVFDPDKTITTANKNAYERHATKIKYLFEIVKRFIAPDSMAFLDKKMLSSHEESEDYVPVEVSLILRRELLKDCELKIMKEMKVIMGKLREFKTERKYVKESSGLSSTYEEGGNFARNLSPIVENDYKRGWGKKYEKYTCRYFQKKSV